MKYLTGCAELFRDGYTDVCQFTCDEVSIHAEMAPRDERDPGSHLGASLDGRGADLLDRLGHRARVVERDEGSRTGHLDQCRVREQRSQPPARAPE